MIYEFVTDTGVVRTTDAAEAAALEAALVANGYELVEFDPADNGAELVDEEEARKAAVYDAWGYN